VKISEAYRREQEILHLREDYGIASRAYAPMVSDLINRFHVIELLDYGSGKGTLAANLKCDHKLTVQMYDPAIPDYSGEPVPMQMVACIDVLEHIEPECLDEVLDDLRRLTQAIGFFTVSTRPAEKTLSDGRNAHLILESPEWWWDKMKERFEIQVFQRLGDEGCFFLVYPKRNPNLIEIPGHA
jgi:hypothetical protein